MSNRLPQLLNAWYPDRDETQWVLATVYKTRGPCYRKAGAMMLLNGRGQHYGLISGGCLEADIARHASQLMQQSSAEASSTRSKLLCYDSSDEDDVSYQLGIGCGGTVYVMLQVVGKANAYLSLDKLYEDLQARRAGVYFQCIPDNDVGKNAAVNHAQYYSSDASDGLMQVPTSVQSKLESTIVEYQERQWLRTVTQPNTHLLIVGAGVDARPLAAMAANLAWELTVCDPRPANARREDFMSAQHILRCPVAELAGSELFSRFDAAVVMSHNLQMDADAVAVLQQSSCRYIALLGPINRRQEVIAISGLSSDDLTIPLAGPAGLAIGANFPEEIALSILAECQAYLNGASAESMSQLLAVQQR